MGDSFYGIYIYVIETSRFIHLIVKVGAIILSEYIQYRYFRLSL